MTQPKAGLGLADGMQLSGMTYGELWIRQLAVGGQSGQLEVEAYVLGLLKADDHLHNVIAQALNEHFLDHDADHPVAYSRPL